MIYLTESHDNALYALGFAPTLMSTLDSGLVNRWQSVTADTQYDTDMPRFIEISHSSYTIMRMSNSWIQLRL